MTGAVLSSDMFQPLLLQTFYAPHLIKFIQKLLYLQPRLHTDEAIDKIHADYSLLRDDKIRERIAKMERHRRPTAVFQQTEPISSPENDDDDEEDANANDDGGLFEASVGSPDVNGGVPIVVASSTGKRKPASSIPEPAAIRKAKKKAPVHPGLDTPAEEDEGLPPLPVRVGYLANQHVQYRTYRLATKGLMLRCGVIPLAVVRLFPVGASSSPTARYPITNPPPDFPLLPSDYIYFIRL